MTEHAQPRDPLERAHGGDEDEFIAEEVATRGADDEYLGEELAMGEARGGFEGEHGERGERAPRIDDSGPI